MQSRFAANSSMQSGHFNSSEHFKVSTKEIIKASAYAMIMALSLFENILVLVVVKTNVGGQRLRSVSNYLLTSMASIGLVTTVFSMPERLVRVLTKDEWLIPGFGGTALCKAANFFEKLGLNVTLLNLVLIAIDRFLVVIFPHKNFLASRRAFFVICCVWIISAVYCIPVLYFADLLEKEDKTFCKFRRFFPNWKAWSVIFLVEQLSTFFVVVVLYIFICYKLIHRKYQTTCISGNRGVSRRNSKVNRKVVLMVAVILLSFYACFAPYCWFCWVACSYQNFSHLCNDTSVFVAIFLTYLSSIMNPLIYCALSEAFREALKSVLWKTCPWVLCCREQLRPPP